MKIIVKGVMKEINNNSEFYWSVECVNNLCELW